MGMELMDIQVTIAAISSRLVIHILSLSQHIQALVILISPFPRFRVLGPMLHLQTIQALTKPW